MKLNLLCVFCLTFMLSLSALAQGTDELEEYRFINTQRSGTLQTELNQNAAAGWKLLLLPRTYMTSMMGALLGRAEEQTKYEYKVLAAARIGTLEKEFKEATSQGFDFRGVIMTERISPSLQGLVSNETLIVLERPVGQTQSKKEYIFLNTKKESTLEKEMEAAVSQGYVPMGFTRTQDNSVKQAMFGIMAGSPLELTMILGRDREQPAGEMGKREFKILTTFKRGTMEKEMNQAAKEGYRFYYSAPGLVTIMGRDPKDKTAQYEYKILGTNRVSTMEKEMNEMSAAGFAYRGTSTGGGGLATIFEKPLKDETPEKYETKLIIKATDTNINKSIRDLAKSDYQLVDVTNLDSFLLVLQRSAEKKTE